MSARDAVFNNLVVEYRVENGVGDQFQEACRVIRAQYAGFAAAHQ
ncbi:hypothetical protein GCM10017566_05420 [Amycolatopsis bartoniae]|uniref:Uncharacterized protein n=1 Tax=Amycolatopsis bartoniae TaxID=941986 RepID=A0A8H9IUP6_9PSEU|nr:hypothetical protein GCM10017566_05420 [Amycolatopsis bartoniae]